MLDIISAGEQTVLSSCYALDCVFHWHSAELSNMVWGKLWENLLELFKN